MPELPDLLYIQSYLRRTMTGRTITAVTIRQPVVLRSALREKPDHALDLMTITEVDLHGPFLTFALSGSILMVVNLMLAGQLQHQRHREHELGFLCLSLKLDDGSRLNLCDQKKMSKVYLVERGGESIIPKYREQGIDILSPGFTEEVFLELAEQNRRRQVRVFINDHTVLSAIGNAYADEILFAAGIHPKAFVATLTRDQLLRLYAAIGEVISAGTRAVADAGQPIHKKIRDHMKVRNRHGEACPRCGGTIRREGVRGYDVFFCPRCQPANRRLFLDWNERPSG